MRGTGKRKPEDVEKSLATTLVGGAFSFIGLAIFATASFVDKTSANALWWGNVICAGAIGALLFSIGAGGKGMNKVGSGPWNAFNVQACSGIAGVLLLVVAAGIFAFNPKADTLKADAAALEAHIHRVEVEQQRQASVLAALATRATSLPSGPRKSAKRIRRSRHSCARRSKVDHRARASCRRAAAHEARQR